MTMGDTHQGREQTDLATDPDAGRDADDMENMAINDDMDHDSAYEGSIMEGDTATLTSTELRFRWEYGRRYHAYRDGEYWGPNDQKQLDAEDFVHSMFLTILNGKLFLAPIGDHLHRVLDAGCGLGIWAVEFARAYPSAEVTGVDLSPVQPTSVPSNCSFEIDDINLEWTWPVDHFDYIHVRMLTGCVPDWTEFHRRAYQHLVPGGWVEQMELSIATKSDDGSLKPDNPLVRWAELFDELGRRTGKTFHACEEAADAIRAAGFVNVSETTLKIPMGTWPDVEREKLWGVWNRRFILDSLEGFALRVMSGYLGWSYERIQSFLTDMRRAILDPWLHGYINLNVTYGQKPLSLTQGDMSQSVD